MKNQQDKSKFINPGLAAIFLFASPLGLYATKFSPIHSKLEKNVIELYMSSSVQHDGASVVGSRLSRKDAARAKIKLLEDLPLQKKNIVVFSNHQMQYLFKGNNYPNLFNMWIGNYGITEIADLVGYIYSNYKNAFPSEILVVAITTPNNDNGGSIIGYRNELPDEIVGHASIISSSKNNNFESLVPLTIKSIVPNLIQRSLEYNIDYKTLLSFGTSFEIVDSEKVSGDFAIDVNGSSTGYSGSGGRNLKFDEWIPNQKLALKDIEEITKSILYLDRIALSAGVKLIVVIPPVHESLKTSRMSSNVNLIFDQAISRVKDKSSTVKFIDDRRNQKYLGVENSDYFYHYDHPSPKYGEELFERFFMF